MRGGREQVLKNQYKEGGCLKKGRELGQFVDLKCKGGLGSKKEGGGVFQGG